MGIATTVDYIDKIKFAAPSKGGLEKTLKKRVDEYFKENGLSKKGDWRLYTKTIILFALLIASFIVAPLATEWWAVFLHYVFRGLIVAGIGFCVMHDASHGCYCENKSAEKLVLFFSGDTMGLSTFVWNIKHVRVHHAYTNIEGHDDDIAQGSILRMNSQQPKKPWHKYQHLYAIGLYMLLSISWIIKDFVRIFGTKMVMHKKIKMDRKEILLFFSGKALCILLFLVIPLLVSHTWQHALIGFFLMHFVLGLTLSLVFQGAHVTEETTFPEPPTMDEWMLHQLATTGNFDRKNKLLSWYVGGLNYQIEHHLFPNISHIHYPHIAGIVKNECEQRGIKYIEFPDSLSMLRSHFRLLKKVGNAT